MNLNLQNHESHERVIRAFVDPDKFDLVNQLICNPIEQRLKYKRFRYCFHSDNVISFSWFKNDNIKWLPLYFELRVIINKIRPRGRGFESRRILDGCKQFASYYIKKLKIKVTKWGTPKKIFKK
jgi:hypothetical protein